MNIERKYNPKKDNKKKGNLGENIAREYLIEQGYSIITSNYRCLKGEIDIIAKEGNIIVFVEVKARTSTKFGYPFEAVDQRKLQRLYSIAQFYIYENKLKDNVFRFDIVNILFDSLDNDNYSVSIIKNVIN